MIDDIPDRHRLPRVGNCRERFKAAPNIVQLVHCRQFHLIRAVLPEVRSSVGPGPGRDSKKHADLALLERSELSENVLVIASPTPNTLLHARVGRLDNAS